MRKMWKWIGIAVVVLVIAVTAWVLTRPDPWANNPAKLEVAFTPEEQHRIDTVTVSPADLAAATCQQGASCWIAVNGVVYDMSGYPKWARGLHHGVHAGTDATAQFVKSGHARAKLEQLPVVGRLG